MMLQSHAGFIEVFPAVPDGWKDVSFKTLRAEGAYLISAVRQNGLTKSVTITSDKGGMLKLKLDTNGFKQKANGKAKMLRQENGYTTIEMGAGGSIVLTN
jgi:alpha-L-fucosidase 2